MQFQWYPGHMTKAKRMMKEDIKLVDLVIELLDARVPLSSRNPDIDELGKNKARLILLNKADLASPKWNEQWVKWFQDKDFFVVKINARNNNGMKAIQAEIDKACQAKKERDRKRGILNRPVRAMVVGIPNVGKSTFINSFAGKASTKTGNKPGVTKGKQWIRLNKNVELLDTPGILWPKFEDQAVGMRLAFIGSMNDEILHTDELAYDLINFLKNINNLKEINNNELENQLFEEYKQILNENNIQLDEGIIKTLAGAGVGYIMGPALGKAICKALGIEKGILYDLMTSKLVTTAISAALSK